MTGADADELAFGDVCEGEFLHEVFLRADAAGLVAKTTRNDFVQRTYGRPEITAFMPVDDSHPALRSQRNSDFLLAHGSKCLAAVCLSDDCEIATRLGREQDAEPSGHLLFAPVTALVAAEEKFLTQRNWGRMTLGAHVVEIRRCFPIEAADVALCLENGALTRSQLDPDDKLRLATWWSAYACRRGPLVDAVNLEKLAAIGAAHGRDVSPLQQSCQNLLAAFWRLESNAVEAAGAAYDDNRETLSAVDLSSILDAIDTDLRAVEEVIGEVHAAINSADGSNP